MTKYIADAKRAHVYATRKEAEALQRRADHARRMGNEEAANKWARKSKLMKAQAYG